MAFHAPTRSLAPFVALAAGSLALDAAPQVPWAAGVAGAGLFASVWEFKGFISLYFIAR